MQDRTEALRYYFKLDGDSYIVGYKQCEEETEPGDCLRLLKGVIPYFTIDNSTSLDFENSYITIEDTLSTEENAVVHVFGRICVDVCCKVSNQLISY